ncbi:NAD(P)H-dependent oxidoreductase [Streptomyces werraensis]|uniref:NAD(P)H-dependent oxidoreductase n=1 Tax=Streptomyces werraensis TaxID=68284 RepID=A0ABV3JIJ4_9ACTN
METSPPRGQPPRTTGRRAVRGRGRPFRRYSAGLPVTTRTAERPHPPADPSPGPAPAPPARRAPPVARRPAPRPSRPARRTRRRTPPRRAGDRTRTPGRAPDPGPGRPRPGTGPSSSEYNRSVTGALKNAIDHVGAEWNNKSVGFVSRGPAGGTRAVEQPSGITGELQPAGVRVFRPARCAVRPPGRGVTVRHRGRAAVATAGRSPSPRAAGLREPATVATHAPAGFRCLPSSGTRAGTRRPTPADGTAPGWVITGGGAPRPLIASAP